MSIRVSRGYCSRTRWLWIYARLETFENEDSVLQSISKIVPRQFRFAGGRDEARKKTATHRRNDMELLVAGKQTQTHTSCNANFA